MNSDLCRFRIANLPHHDDVGILSDYGAQSCGEGQADLGVDLYLIDPMQLILDGVLDGEDLLLRGEDGAQGGVQGRRLTAAGRPGSEDHPVRKPDQLLHPVVSFRQHPDVRQGIVHGAAVEQAQHHTLSV